jgi:polyisoprenyl-phosphate glycosyltransferase
MKLLSIVIPVYNEEESLPHLRRRLGAVVEAIRRERALAVEVLLVDDGSVDGSRRFLEEWAVADPALRVLRLSRNFGHQAALTAGLDAARGDGVVLLDADLQDPPEVIPRLLDRAAEGYDVVYAQRTARAGEGLYKRATAWLFYRLMKGLVHRDLPADTGDFRLITGRALDAVRGLRERHRFLRGLSVWIGFRQAAVPYAREARAAGHTKFSTLKMLRFAWDAGASFTTLPLKLVALWGTLVSLFGLLYLVYTIYRYFVYQDTVKGWPSLIVLLCVIGGSILISLGILGSYVGKVFEEVKGRPLYIVERAAGAKEDRDDQHLAERVDVPRRVGVEHVA